MTTFRAILAVSLASAAIVGGNMVTTAAIAQERASDDDNDRDDSNSRPRGNWGSRWRQRDEQRDKKSNAEESAKSESNNRDADDAPAMTPESWAKSLITKHDKNDNKVLDGDERTGLTGPARTADFNKDGFITGEEISASLANATAKSPEQAGVPAKADTTDQPADKADGEVEKSKRATSEQPSKTESPSKRVFTWTGGGKPGEAIKSTRRTYRFTPARERLPSELPSWFKSQDKNGDGQVAMSEYARSWSKSTIAKFQGYDADGDGVVTAMEAAGKK